MGQPRGTAGGAGLISFLPAQGLALGLLGAFAALALADWIGVATRFKPLEYVCKPAAMLALLGVALTLSPVSSAQRSYWVVALALCVIGDIFLMLPRDRFVPGLVAFLVAHLAYVGGFAVRTGVGETLFLPALAVAGLGLILSRPILAAMRRNLNRNLIAPVVGYMLAISGTLTLALTLGAPAAMAGALLFYMSDAMIAFNRFVKPRRAFPLAIIVTYHLGQALLVLSLLS